MDSFESFLDTASSKSHLRVEADLGDGFVRLRSDEAERRQAAQDIRCSEDIVLELLRNARDAHATLVFLASTCSDGKRIFTMIDNGEGIPSHLHETVFEPRVTSKLDSFHADTWGVHGRGMALFSIRQNAQDARICASGPGLGTAITVQTDLSALPEKSDQSTFPSFHISEENSMVVRGPKNIVRTACEFALQERNALSVFYGTPAEIAAGLYEYAESAVPFALRAFSRDVSSVPFVKLPAYMADSAELTRCLEQIGLPLSQKTAQRILNREIHIPDTLLDRIVTEGMVGSKGKPARPSMRKTRMRQRLRPSGEDIARLEDSVKESFATFAEKYYLCPDVEPHVQVRSDSLVIRIPLSEESQ